MEAKKTPKADLSKRTGLHFGIGLLITMGMVLVAFQWKTYDQNAMIDTSRNDLITEEIIEPPPTEQPPPPPPKIQQPEIIEVEDEEEIEEEIEVDLDIEITEETVIEDIEFTEEPEEEVAEEVFTIVEDQPTPKGGMKAFYKYVNKNMRYPSQAKRMGIEGKVYVQFVVDKDGSITEVQAIRGIGAGCDEEAVRVIKGMPKWTPGKQRGRPVKVRMVLPIVFKLQ